MKTHKKIQENGNPIVSPGGQHIAARRCIACNPENGSRGMNRLAGLQRRQAVSRNFQKRDKIQCNFNLHIPSHPEQHETYT